MRSIPELRRPKREDPKFEVSLAYIERIEEEERRKGEKGGERERGREAQFLAQRRSSVVECLLVRIC